MDASLVNWRQQKPGFSEKPGFSSRCSYCFMSCVDYADAGVKITE